jgi:hypothetical protein
MVVILLMHWIFVFMPGRTIMKTDTNTSYAVILLLVCILTPWAQGAPLSRYFDQEPPGVIPKVFAPGIICIQNESDATFSPDGNDFCFKRGSRAMHTTYTEDGWTVPAVVPSITGTTYNLRFSEDGRGLYYGVDPGTMRISRRTEQGWAAYETLPGPINSSAAEWGGTALHDGTFFVCSHRSGGRGGCDIWTIPCVDGQYMPAENITVLNTSSNDCMPAVTADGRYLLQNSSRPGGYGQMDLYISVREQDGSWSAPRNLGSVINTSGMERAASITPDGKYLLYSRSPRIYWVEIGAFLPDPNGPIENLTSGQRFSLLQCAVNYSNNGDEIVLSPGTYQENIDLLGKDLILRSVDPNNPSVTEETTIQGNGTKPVVMLNKNSDQCMFKGLTITGGRIGLNLQQASPRIEHCRIIDNAGHGIDMQAKSEPLISHTLICGNGGAGISMTPYVDIDFNINNEPDLINCTVAQNSEEGIQGGMVAMRNCIVYGNGTSQLSPVSATVTYSCIQGGYDGLGNIDADPLFAALTYLDPNSTPDDPNDDLLVPGDYHLKSQAGRYDPNSMDWVLDEVTSPCIDAGDPNSDVGDEPDPNGGIINLGAYGGTIQASKTLEED